MIRPDILPAIAMLYVCVLGVERSRAQFSPTESGMSGIVGTGTVTLERQPELIRLRLMIPAEGKDVQEAMSKLKEKETVARAKLQKLGAAAASIQFADPQTRDASQRQQMERMLQMRTGRSPRPAKNQTPTLSVFTTLKAEWPLGARDGDALLIESLELEAKIKSAQLGGDKSDKSSAAEQEEAAEEAQVVSPEEAQANPRDPVFLFVSRISEADRDKARAAAFTKARDDAERLAKASGNQLGPIRLLASNAAPSFASNPETEMFDGGYQQRMMYNLMNRQEGDEPLEAIGPQPGKVGYRITVYVSFAVKP